MLKFSIENGRVVVDGLHLGLKDIADVMKKYPEEMAIRVLTYVHLVSRVDNSAPFFTAAEEEIRELAAIQLFSEKEWNSLNHKQLDKVVTAYTKMYETPEIRLVRIFNDKVDQIRKLIQDTAPEIKSYTTSSGSAGYTSNLKIITSAMSELGDLLDVKEKLEAKIRKEVTGGKMRGGKKPSRLERKMMKKT